MKEQIQERLDTLRNEFSKGQTQLAELENQAAALRQTLLRITGAIQVLEELIAAGDSRNESEIVSKSAEL